MTAAAVTTTRCRHHHRQRNNGNGNFRIWNSFSAAAFRRKIIDSIRCGGGSFAGCFSYDLLDDTLPHIPIPIPKPKLKPNNTPNNNNNEYNLQKPPAVVVLSNKPARSVSETAGSEKLSDFLNHSSSSSSESSSSTTSSSLEGAAPEVTTEDRGGRKVETEDEEEAVRRKVEKFQEMSKAVKLLQTEGSNNDNEEEEEEEEDKRNGAKLVRRLAKEDSEARTTLAMLGAIPPLVGMLDVQHYENENENENGGGQTKNGVGDEIRIEALYALLNLGIGNDLNKAAIVQAGAVHKMLKLIDSSNGSPHPSVSEAIVANFLALTALDSNKPIIGSSGAIPFLAKTLNLDNTTSHASYQAKQDALRALYNISILPSNLPLILETDLVHHFISSLDDDPDSSEIILSTLSNVISTPQGRKAISSVPDSLPILIDVLNWVDSPGCQEKASYILMVMAHKSYNDRQAMVEAGISSALLELTLIGTALAQKRAARILECLRMDKGKRVVLLDGNNNDVKSLNLSAPMYGVNGTPSSSSSLFQDIGSGGDGAEEEMMMSEENRAVKQLVQQSLMSNMNKIVKRANLPQDFVPSDHLIKSLTLSSTSKSLTF